MLEETIGVPPIVLATLSSTRLLDAILFDFSLVKQEYQPSKSRVMYLISNVYFTLSSSGLSLRARARKNALFVGVVRVPFVPFRNRTLHNNPALLFLKDLGSRQITVKFEPNSIVG